MKKVKILALIMAMVICCALMSGCMAMVVDTKINNDYSGTMSLTSGISKEMYESLSEEEKTSMQIDETSVFEYDGKQYLGSTEKIEFRNILELNDTSTGEETGVDSGLSVFSINEDGEIEWTYTVTEEVGMTEDMKTDVANGAAMSGVTTGEEYQAILESFVIKSNWEFPRNVMKVSGPELKSIVVKDNLVMIDIMKLTEECKGKEYTFKFVTYSGGNNFEQKIMFDDVVKDDWFYNQVYKMVDEGLFVGKTDKLFCPKDTMTKAEFVTVIARMMHDEDILKTYTKNESVWWDGYYNACINDGIFTSENMPYEKMDKGIKREEMAFIASAFLTKIKNESGADVIVPVVMSQIPDKNLINEKYTDGVAYCYQKGIICGINDKGTFNPQATLTRAEATTVIDRILNKDVRVLPE